ncbi:DUF4282 domain-containing protein [Alkalibacterium sp. f15]|uniref:DUF4282 domain-containing protein n=1 Tax=Alkalibacterium sp. f15 TaxID=3414029 RepID=UPI003BF7D47A
MDNSTSNEVQQNSKSFFKFDNMITPKIIQIIFFLGLVISVLAGLLMIVAGDMAFAGLVVIIMGPLLVRVNCEIIIVLFKIHEALQDIRYR